jgi:hypothetical protein
MSSSASFAFWVPFEGLSGDAAWWFPQLFDTFLFILAVSFVGGGN